MKKLTCYICKENIGRTDLYWNHPIYRHRKYCYECGVINRIGDKK